MSLIILINNVLSKFNANIVKGGLHLKFNTNSVLSGLNVLKSDNFDSENNQNEVSSFIYGAQYESTCVQKYP